MNRKKIINDPIYGFVTISDELIYQIISHPYFQRLRHIRQLGLTEYVYPAAHHSRFQHALGAMHLMGKALNVLQDKGVEISAEEFQAAQIAVLLHDSGHGPFSHALEETLTDGVQHESLSYLFIEELNKQFSSSLDLCIRIFRNSYERKFFHQLVSSQLDMDRLDYLQRDSFFTGVQEGRIGLDRIILMLEVVDDELVIAEKGIYSIEQFLQARRLMFWQVYLHKVTISTERMLINIIRRAQLLSRAGHELPMSESLHAFINRSVSLQDFYEHPRFLQAYGTLDDHDIWAAIKLWRNSGDKILSWLCEMLMTRNLFKVHLTAAAVQRETIARVREQIGKTFGLLQSEIPYLFSQGTVSNEAYHEGEQIRILRADDSLVDIGLASDLPYIKAMSKIVKKNYLCWPKNVSL